MYKHADLCALMLYTNAHNNFYVSLFPLTDFFMLMLMTYFNFHIFKAYTFHPNGTMSHKRGHILFFKMF